MKIGLVDVDGKVNSMSHGGSVYPNLALCKLSAYHKAKGDSVEWATPMEHYDIVYMSKVFTFSTNDTYVYDADRIVRGGTGYSLDSRLPDEVDGLQPDMTIYPNLPPNTSYGFLTRGCPNKCKWCVVPRKEGAARPYMDIDEVANGRKNVVLMDNNILACGDYAAEQLTKIAERGYHVDFNQALDARLVTEENARLLARIKWIRSRIRFGCDTKAQIAECSRAMALIREAGYTGEFFLYTMLYGDIHECLHRLSYWRSVAMRYRESKEGSNVLLHSQPYRDPSKGLVPIPQWQRDMAQWTNRRQLFMTCEFKDFEPRKGFKCNQYLEQ